MEPENASHSRSRRHEPAWHKSRVVGSKPPLTPKQVGAVRSHLQREQRVRDLALFDLATGSKLRGCDLVRLRIGDVVSSGEVRPRAIVVQQKTGRTVQFEITETARNSVVGWLKRRSGTVDEHLFPSRVDRSGHITTRQYARLVDEWLAAVGLNPASDGTHLLRQTKVSVIHQRTGNLRAVQILLGHTRLESTVRYLGVDIEDALTLAEAVDI